MFKRLQKWLNVIDIIVSFVALERNYKGLQGEFVLTGIDYLYALPLGKHVRMEFSLGLGYFYSQAREYTVYTQGGKGYKEKDMAKIIPCSPQDPEVAFEILWRETESFRDQDLKRLVQYLMTSLL